MKTFGLLGYPLCHSFSARFFTEKFEREGIAAQYLNFEYATVEEALSQMLSTHPDLCGFNVTIPHKQAVLPYLSSISSEAEEIGAVNVVRVERSNDGAPRLVGFNSDIIGFKRSILPLLRPGIHRRALVLGTGGASRAVTYGLRQLGVTPCYVSRAPRPGGFTYGNLTPEVMAAHTVVVNCTPLGMYPRVETAPGIPYEFLTSSHLLYDLVYNPEETQFLKLGAQRGAIVKNGFEMLELQALAAWEIWNGDVK